MYQDAGHAKAKHQLDENTRLCERFYWPRQHATLPKTLGCFPDVRKWGGHFCWRGYIRKPNKVVEEKPGFPDMMVGNSHIGEDEGSILFC